MVRYSVEFHHLSWMRSETWDLLKEHNVAYTNVYELPLEVQWPSDWLIFADAG